ncbi:MAG: phenylalanine--tRNA ligase subunit alpha [Promethearchaeota archaeon]
MTKAEKIEISSFESEIFQTIQKKKEVTLDALLSETGQSHAKVRSALSKLETFQLIEIKEQTEKVAYLTERGNYAAAHGLIERVIIQYLLENPAGLQMKQLQEKLGERKKELSVSIGLLKRYNLIKMEKGVLIPHNTTKKFNLNLQKALEHLTEDISAEKIDTDVLNELKERGMLELDKRKKVAIKISPYAAVKSKNVQIVDYINRLTSEMIRTGSWRNKKLAVYDLDVEAKRSLPGKHHPYFEFLNELKYKLIGLGFQEVKGPIVELEFWNFDALFQPQNHPSREWTDVYFLKSPKRGKLPSEPYVQEVARTHENGGKTGSKGWSYHWSPEKSAQLMLRAHSTAVSARALTFAEIPGKYFTLSRCYRPDKVDATHTCEFLQFDGIVCAKAINFRNLLWVLKTFAVEMAGAEEVYFRPDYYPFTEPSVELGAIVPKIGRIEFGGAGIFRPEVSVPFGLKEPVIAWGLGVDRLFMAKYGITDIREIITKDIEWLRDASVI